MSQDNYPNPNPDLPEEPSRKIIPTIAEIEELRKMDEQVKVIEEEIRGML